MRAQPFCIQQFYYLMPVISTEIKLTMRRIASILPLLILIAFVTGCKKENESITIPGANDYYPLSAGKYSVYRLDSTVTVNFGAALVVRSYTAKDSIISTFNDNLGNTSYLVYRYLSDTLMSQSWAYQSAYYITPFKNKVEVTDANNMRFIKLTIPIQDGNNWKGNTYIDTKSFESDVRYMDEWDYTYENVNSPYVAGAITYDSTATVLQKDILFPDAPFDVNAFQQRDLSVEVYGKNVGLVYKEFLHWVWQPAASQSSISHYEDGSFGIKLTLLYHN